jgi:hypothetical protein
MHDPLHEYNKLIFDDEFRHQMNNSTRVAWRIEAEANFVGEQERSEASGWRDEPRVNVQRTLTSVIAFDHRW